MDDGAPALATGSTVALGPTASGVPPSLAPIGFWAASLTDSAMSSAGMTHHLSLAFVLATLHHSCFCLLIAVQMVPFLRKSVDRALVLAIRLKRPVPARRSVCERSDVARFFSAFPATLFLSCCCVCNRPNPVQALQPHRLLQQPPLLLLCHLRSLRKQQYVRFLCIW
jgi:hypothetical protein